MNENPTAGTGHHDAMMADVSRYYEARLAEHGETARGVDWNGEDSQTLRFRQLCGIIRGKGDFSINDLGCGYGALYDFLVREYDPFFYTGIDISENMIRAAENRHRGKDRIRFVRAAEPDRTADYGVASGIFNVRLDRSDTAWERFIRKTLDALDRTSRVGFAFNCLTVYSDPDRMRDHLYYADPGDRKSVV